MSRRRRRRGEPDAPIVAQRQPAIDHQRNAAAIANLAEGIQALVGHMRTEQQQIRDWVDAQAAAAGGHRQAAAPPARTSCEKQR